MQAALTVPGWETIETGRVPDTWAQICLIASALGLGRSWVPYLHDLYVGAHSPSTTKPKGRRA